MSEADELLPATDTRRDTPWRGAAARRADILPPIRGKAVETWYQVLEREDVETSSSLRRPVIAGTVAVLLGFGGFLGWAFSADLDSAAVATGTVVVDSKRKTVSHLEGGILKRLLVQEGDVVRADQPVAQLDDTRARSDLQQYRGKRIGLLAKLARLRAEQGGAEQVDFPAPVLDPGNPIAVDVLTAERRLFQRRHESYDGKVAIQRKEIEQRVAEAESLTALMEATDHQREFLGERLKGMRELAAKGFVGKAQLLEQEARLSELVGRSGDYAAQKAKSEKAKASAEATLASIDFDWQSDVANQLQDAQLQLNEVENQITTAKDVLDRLTVRAPQDGAVVNIQMRTPGGAIPAGQAIMDVVPEKELMVVEARLGTREIVSVQVGSKTQVRLTAYDHRVLAPLDGKLSYVAADQTIDPQTQNAYYVIRAEIDQAQLAQHPSVSLYPGMPAELLVLKKPRRAIDYLFGPVTESFNRAFREN
ncbi:HlyD family type I secretion periplasmic adaptor subunit [Azorhizobium doebereinerae]|uniref:HlyD family type I secretion periplasmic adaptor subunit n=1 Tax=Azorhizobium doebereinerae TaxID=281091 RepID=UPI00041583EB|nr:HlyD family type I secretion periplasmic adaptor subunit [Azorhizobium doebereinerae]